MDEKLPGIERPHLQALPQIGDRMTLLYLEHCQLNREDGAILIRDTRGTVAVPAAGISVMTMQQLRGKEGSRVRKIYREASKQRNIPSIPRARGGDPLPFPAMASSSFYSPHTRG